MEAIIVGGGIGGLSAALALHQHGVEVTILERAEGPVRGGTALSLWPNALRALDALGLGDEVRAHSALGGDSGIRRPDGQWLGRSKLGAAIRNAFEDPLVIIPRQQLTELLLAKLPPDTLRYGQMVSGITPGSQGEEAIVHTVAGETRTDLVVIADGARSALRARLFPAAPGLSYAGYTAWRMIVPAPSALESFETWGPEGRRFAVLPLADGSCYSYATVNTAASGSPDSEVNELRRLFGDWHQPIPGILSALTETSVRRDDISDLPPLPAFHAGRAALLGDAAHAMTPELGQGACLAGEDAVVLAAAVNSGGPEHLASSLERYTNARKPRTSAIAKRSRQAGRLHQQPLLIRYLAARAMSRIPAKTITRGLRPVVEWYPPAPGPAPSL